MLEANPPKGIVVVSAHWENQDAFRPGVIGRCKQIDSQWILSLTCITVNNNFSNPLIYDFYGFPKHLYELKFRSRAEPELQNKVIEALTRGGITVNRADRGLDHGVWGELLHVR